MKIASWLLSGFFLAATILAAPVPIAFDQAEAASKKKKSKAAQRGSNWQEAVRLDEAARERFAKADYAEAQALWERALAILEKALGPDHANVARILHNLAATHDLLGHYADAQGLHERALGS